MEFDENGQAISQGKKPANPKSCYTFTGFYIYENRVLDIAASIKPLSLSELEITDVNRANIEMGDLRVEMMGRGMAWLDTETHDSLLQ